MNRYKEDKELVEALRRKDPSITKVHVMLPFHTDEPYVLSAALEKSNAPIEHFIVEFEETLGHPGASYEAERQRLIAYIQHEAPSSIHTIQFTGQDESYSLDAWIDGITNSSNLATSLVMFEIYTHVLEERALAALARLLQVVNHALQNLRFSVSRYGYWSDDEHDAANRGIDLVASALCLQTANTSQLQTLWIDDLCHEQPHVVSALLNSLHGHPTLRNLGLVLSHICSDEVTSNVIMDAVYKLLVAASQPAQCPLHDISLCNFWFDAPAMRQLINGLQASQHSITKLAFRGCHFTKQAGVVFVQYMQNTNGKVPDEGGTDAVSANDRNPGVQSLHVDTCRLFHRPGDRRDATRGRLTSRERRLRQERKMAHLWGQQLLKGPHGSGLESFQYTHDSSYTFWRALSRGEPSRHLSQLRIVETRAQNINLGAAIRHIPNLIHVRTLEWTLLAHESNVRWVMDLYGEALLYALQQNGSLHDVKLQCDQGRRLKQPKSMWTTPDDERMLEAFLERNRRLPEMLVVPVPLSPVPAPAVQDTTGQNDNRAVVAATTASRAVTTGPLDHAAASTTNGDEARVATVQPHAEHGHETGPQQQQQQQQDRLSLMPSLSLTAVQTPDLTFHHVFRSILSWNQHMGHYGGLGRNSSALRSAPSSAGTS